MADFNGDKAKQDDKPFTDSKNSPSRNDISFGVPEVEEGRQKDDQARTTLFVTHEHPPLHHRGGLYVKEEERRKHHELADKLEEKYTQEELAWKQKNLDDRQKKIAEKDAERDEHLNKILSQ